MAGVVQVVLTDADLARLLRWGAWLDQFDAADIALYQRLQAQHRSVACAAPKCAVPREHSVKA